jgi:transcriptional regulator with XRE-family HTH domain
MSIGQRIKHARKQIGISQAELAQKVGIKQPTLSDLENDMSKGTTKLASIAKVLRVRPYWLETGKGPSEAEGPDNVSDSTALSEEAFAIAIAFDSLELPAQREAIRAQLRAFGVEL